MTEADTTDPIADPEARYSIETYRLDWQGITVEITYEACWLSMPHNEGRMAHLAIRSLAPAKAPLPITGTGYRSHFTAPGVIAEAGGPVEFVVAWLDAEARTPAWRKHIAATMQPSLF